jgi:chloride channel 7
MNDSEPLLVPGVRRDRSLNHVGTDADDEDNEELGDGFTGVTHDAIYEVHAPPSCILEDFSHTTQSLDYDTVENVIWEDDQMKLTRREQAKRIIVKWVITLMIGIITGVFAFAMAVGIQYIIVGKLAAMSRMLALCGNGCWWGPLVAFVGINLGAVLIASTLVTFVEPAAGGSGIPEIKCYLNGVKVPHVVRIQTLVIKVLGTVLSVGGGMALGKEGPMIHTGAIVAAGVSQGKATSLAWSWDGGALKSFRNDREKRDFVSAGAAAGVGAAFGAPIGGVMFSLEEGSSFWNQEVTLRTFFCSVIATFTLNFWISGALGGQWGSFINPGLHFGAPGRLTWTVAHFPLFLGVACIGGVLGALFNAVNAKLTRWRTRWSKWPRWAEALIISLFVSLLVFGVSAFQGNCVPQQASAGDSEATGVQLLCAPGHVNDMATLFMAPQDEVIRYLFNTDEFVSRVTLFVFFVVYLCCMIICYGSSVPGALFVPSLLAGSAWGRLIGSLLAQALPGLRIDPGAFALIGAASLLGGITRMTLALTVILIESTANTSYGLPLMMSLLTAKWVGDLFNHGALEITIEAKRIPLLGWDAPFTFRKFRARHVMQPHPVCLPAMVSVSRVIDTLSSNTHNGFPVLNARGQFVGLVLRSQIISLLKARAFQVGDQVGVSNRYRHLPLDTFLADYPRYPSIEDVLKNLKIDDPDLFINLEPYLNPSPFVMRDESSLSRVFRLFRTMGLRHLVIVNIHNEVVGIITRKDLIHLNSGSVRKREQRVE